MVLAQDRVDRPVFAEKHKSRQQEIGKYRDERGQDELRKNLVVKEPGTHRDQSEVRTEDQEIADDKSRKAGVGQVAESVSSCSDEIEGDSCEGAKNQCGPERNP